VGEFMMHNTKKELFHTQFLQRENFLPPQKYEDELSFLSFIKNGDLKGLNKAMESAGSNKATGRLSENPLRNEQYLFICLVAVITRMAIEMGLEPQFAYNISDSYIQTIDKCASVTEVNAIRQEMLEFFVGQFNKLNKQNIYSKPIIQCLDYIYDHLHQVITVDELADTVKLSRAYLSTLFKNELGISVSEYIRRKRVEAAENMLRYSDLSLQEISQYLSFCSYSHFADIFRKYTRDTPKEYRNKYYRKA
jgi:YesN/AraC family two-component response regulator